MKKKRAKKRAKRRPKAPSTYVSKMHLELYFREDHQDGDPDKLTHFLA